MVENLDDRLGIFGARFPYFERRFQFRNTISQTNARFLAVPRLVEPLLDVLAHIG